MRLPIALLLPWLFLASLISANVEKVLFVAPEGQEQPQDASIANLLLPTLSPSSFSIRAFLNATFPSDDAKKGSQTWMLLEKLTPGQRYEVRVCWLATQPTAFWLYTHSMTTAWESPELLSALTSYSFARHLELSEDDIRLAQSEFRKSMPSKRPTTFLFLQIFAAADYFTLNKTLMETVPPVHADVILDPYLLNILPQSLLPTAGYLMVIAICGWFLSGWLHNFIVSLAKVSEDDKAKKSD